MLIVARTRFARVVRWYGVLTPAGFFDIFQRNDSSDVISEGLDCWAWANCQDTVVIVRFERLRGRELCCAVDSGLFGHNMKIAGVDEFGCSCNLCIRCDGRV